MMMLGKRRTYRTCVLLALLLHSLLLVSVRCEETQPKEEAEKDKEAATTEETAKDEKPKTIHINLNDPEENKRFVDSEENTRLLDFEYWVKTETQIQRDDQHLAPIETEANYDYSILHHDIDGQQLGRYHLRECIRGQCEGSVPDVYIEYMQGANSLEGLFMSIPEGEEDRKPRWSLLHSLALLYTTPSRSGEGDVQIVPTPYGICRVRLERPQDRIFKRTIEDCSLDTGLFNHTWLPDSRVVKYRQSVQYIQSAKVNADIVMIKAEETVQFISSVDNAAPVHTVVHSTASIEARNRTSKWTKKHCLSSMLGGECAETAFGAKKIGRTYAEIIANLDVFTWAHPQLEHALVELEKSASSESEALAFLDVLEAIRLADEPTLKAAVGDPRWTKSTAVGSKLVQALGLSGTGPAVLAARSIIEGRLATRNTKEKTADNDDDGDNDGDGDYQQETRRWLEEFARSTISAIQPTDGFYKQLVYWWSSTLSSSSSSFANTHLRRVLTNSLARRLAVRCSATLSATTACHTRKDKVVEKFVGDLLASCESTETGCQIDVIEALENLPYQRAVELVAPHICNGTKSKRSLQRAALRLLAKADPLHIDQSLGSRLVRVFAGTCPLRSQVTDSRLAADVIVRIVPHLQLVGTQLLRVELIQSSGAGLAREAEKWNYLYEAIRQSMRDDELKADYWNQLRAFRLFRPNWSQRSLSPAQSTLVVRSLLGNESAPRELVLRLGIEYSQSLFVRSQLDIAVRSEGRRTNTHLFGVAIDTEALQPTIAGFVDGLEPSGDDDDEEDEQPSVSGRVSLAGGSEPRLQLAEGSIGLLAALWSADGSRHGLLDSRLPLHLHSISVPLISGLWLRARTHSLAHVSVDGAATASLLSRSFQGDISIHAQVTSVHSTAVGTDRLLNSLELRRSGTGGASSNIETSMEGLPPRFCFSIASHPYTVRESDEWLDRVQTTDGSAAADRREERTLQAGGQSVALSRFFHEQCTLLQGSQSDSS